MLEKSIKTIKSDSPVYNTVMNEEHFLGGVDKKMKIQAVIVGNGYFRVK